MELYLNRHWFTNKSTGGELFINDLPSKECFTLEPPVSHRAEGSFVAIPEGRYEVTMYDSPKNKRRVPILNNVPGHEYIEIHILNFPNETEGCIGVGQERGLDFIENSEAAFESLVPKIDNALTTTKVFITLKNQGA